MSVDAEGAAEDRDPAAGWRRRGSGELTRLVLDALRKAGRALTPGEVQTALTEAGAGPLAYSTVVTTLSRLHASGAADRYRVGRAYAYQAVADQAELAARRMRRVLDAEDDRGAVLARFVGELSGRDESLLREFLGTDLDTRRRRDDTAGD
jgi:predicted transcriptional regulator